MKYLIVKDYIGLWEVEYRTSGMKNSDNESVVGIKSRRKNELGEWVENHTDLDDEMIALGLPNHLGYRFNEAAIVALAESKNLTIIKKYEMDSPIELAHSNSAYAFITSFELEEQTGSAIIDDEAGTIGIEVEYGTDVTALEPVIVLSDGATVSPVSGAGTNFTTPVTYTVTAENGVTEKEYLVTVAIADPSTEALLLSFALAEQTGDAVIDHDLETVSIEVANGTVVTALEPTVTVSDYATVSPLSGVATDFTNPVNYTVTAQDGVTTKVYAVTVTEAAA